MVPRSRFVFPRWCRLKTEILDIDVKLKTEKDFINIDKLNIKTDWANAQITGVIPTTFNTLADLARPDSAYTLKGKFNCDLAAISSQIPHTLGLKEATVITSGRLTGNIETLTKNGKRVITGQVSLTDLAGTIEGKQIAISEPIIATTKITSDKTTIYFDELKATSAFCQIECTGTSKLLNYNADIDLTKLQSELGPFLDIGQYKIAGHLISNGQISSRKNKIVATGSSSVESFSITSPQQITASEPKADLSFSVTAETDKKIIKVDSFQANTSFGQIATKKAILPISKDAKESLDLPLSVNVDLAGVRPFAIVLLEIWPLLMRRPAILYWPISMNWPSSDCSLVKSISAL